jgi:hypothetical protein
MNLYSINTGYFKLDGGAMFGVVPKSMWNKLNPADENNLCSWAMRCLLIEDGNRLILVDNGMGDKQDAKFFGHYYLHGNDSLDSSLAKHGFHRNDITDVFLTHLHFDHCGGSISRAGNQLIPAFKNAQFWSNENHWQWATEPNDREKASFLKENILPIKESGQLKMIGMQSMADDRWPMTEKENSRSDGQRPSTIEQRPSKIIDDLSIRFVNQISHKGKTIVFMADLLPSVAHLPIPYVMAYDMFPLTTLNEKKSFLSEAVQNDYILFFEHDPMNECCTLQQTEKGIRSKEVFMLSEIG